MDTQPPKRGNQGVDHESWGRAPAGYVVQREAKREETRPAMP